MITKLKYWPFLFSLGYIWMFKVEPGFFLVAPHGSFRQGQFLLYLIADIIIFELWIIARCNLWRIDRLKRIDKGD